MSTKNIIFIIIAALLIGGGLAVLFFIQNEKADISLPTERLAAPEFVLKDYEGQEVKLSDFRGKPAVINSWAAWCPFCREELQDFAALQNEFGDRIVIIAIDRRESLETAKGYSDKLGVADKMVFLLDPEDSFYKSIGGFSMPETIFVDQEGLIKSHKRGPMDLEEMRRRVRDAFDF